jgi:phosphate-selective porin OprO/OprP
VKIDRLVVLGMLPVVLASGAHAQSSTSGSGGHGIELASADGELRLRLRGYVQLDGRWFTGDDGRATDTLIVRRARPILEGTLYGRFGFRIMPDFGGGKSELTDGWVEARFAKVATLRAGKLKPPLGLERLQSAIDLALVERGLPTGLVPYRDIGIQLSGEIAAGRLGYEVGVFNGVIDGGGADSDAGDAKEIVGRLVWRPLTAGAGTDRGDLGLGLAASRGDETGTAAAPALASYRSPGQQTFFTYRSDGTVPGTTVAAGRRARWAPQGWFYRGPYGVLAEWVSSSQRVARDGASTELAHTAWQVQLSWVPTGERNSFRGVAPRQSAGSDGGRGAWLVALRASGLSIDSKAFPVFADSDRGARRARALGAAVSWNLRRDVRWMLDYEWTRFDGGAAGGADRGDERVLSTRFQIAF